PLVQQVACGLVSGRQREVLFFFFQAEDGIRDFHVTGVQTCALPISRNPRLSSRWKSPNAGSSRAHEVAVATSSRPGFVHVPSGRFISVASQAPSLTFPSKFMCCGSVTNRPPSMPAGVHFIEW